MADNWLQALLGGGFQAVPPGGLLGNMGGDEEGYRGFMNSLNNNRNMIAGLGLGLLSGTKYNPYGNVMQGFAAGAHLDNERAKMAQAQIPSDVREYQYAKSTGQFDGTYPEWLEKKANFGAQYGLNPQWMQKPDGSYAPVQLNSRGQPREVPLPGGGQWTIPGQWKDTGTGFQNVPSRTAPYGTPGQPTTSAIDAEGRPVVSEGAAPVVNGPPGYVPKDVRGKAQENTIGTETGKAITQLPQLEANTTRAIARLGELERHPGLDAATGFVMGKLPALTPAARDARARIEEIQSTQWTQGVQDLRGMGALSNAEGSRIENARSRLAATDVGTEDYKKAIRDIRDVLKTGLENARKIASGKMKPYSTGGASDPLGLR